MISFKAEDSEMSFITDEIEKLRSNEPEVARILDVFGEIDRVYSDVLKAMGVPGTPISEVSNSAKVVVSFTPVSSTLKS